MRGFLGLLAMIAIAGLVGGAGYLGMQGAQAEAQPTPQAPPTVEVTRGEVRQTVTAPGQLVGTRETVLALSVGGQLAEIAVRPGEVVRQGQLLARLERAPLQEALDVARLKLAQAEVEQEHQLAEAQLNAQIASARLGQAQARFPGLAAAEAGIAAAQAELQRVQEPTSEQAVIVARADLANAEAALQQAQAAYDQVKWRNDIGALPESQQLQQATNNHLAARARLEALTKGPSQASVASAQAQLQQARAQYNQVLNEQAASSKEAAVVQAQVQQAQVALSRLEAGISPLLARDVATAEANLAASALHAPFDGIVLEVLARPGENVAPGSGLLVLADPTAVEVQATVIEEDLPVVQVGQPVELFFDARADLAVAGRVARIVPQRVRGEDRPLYPIYLSLDVPPTGVVAGMTADAAIIIAQRQDVVRLPRALVRAQSKDEAQVRVWANNQIETRTVKLGLRGDVYVEIVAGLQAGEQVVGE
jgi:HlyD family secretion protein